MKRCFDAAAAAVLLVVLSPVMAATALLVRIKLGRPVLYRQVRPGLHEKPFVLYKFRTMADLRDERGNPLPDAERLTPFGRKLRTLSLDELPQLFNVLKGDLSLVGPRPLLMEYLPLYTEEQRQRHLVRPGITGWAQVNGRNAVSWEERFAMDVWYVRNRSMLLDLKILLLTFLRLFKPVGIHQPGRATMDRFTGTGTPG
jgi:sugar transferase EpsL